MTPGPEIICGTLRPRILVFDVAALQALQRPHTYNPKP